MFLFLSTLVLWYEHLLEDSKKLHFGLRGVDLHFKAKVVGRFKLSVRGVINEISLAPIVPVVEDEPK